MTSLKTIIGIGCIAIAVIPGVNVLAATGLAALCGSNKAAGWFTIADGTCEIAAGVCMLLP